MEIGFGCGWDVVRFTRCEGLAEDESSTPRHVATDLIWQARLGLGSRSRWTNFGVAAETASCMGMYTVFVLCYAT